MLQPWPHPEHSPSQARQEDDPQSLFPVRGICLRSALPKVAPMWRMLASTSSYSSSVIAGSRLNPCTGGGGKAANDFLANVDRLEVGHAGFLDDRDVERRRKAL